MIDIEIKYQAGHTIRETWQKTALYCPHCGVPGIWEDTNYPTIPEESYSQLCAACGKESSIDDYDGENPIKRQRLEAIRKAL